MSVFQRLGKLVRFPVPPAPQSRVTPRKEGHVPGDHAVARLVSAFLLSRERAGCRASTLALYRHWLGAYQKWVGERALEDAVFAPDTLAAYLHALRTRGLAQDTLSTNYRVLKTLCRWLVEQGELARDPFNGPGKVPPPPLRKLRRAVWSDDDIARMLSCTAPVTWLKRVSPTRPRTRFTAELERERRQARALILLLCDTAMRAGEVAGLTCGQLRKPELVIVGKGGHEGVVFVGPETRQELTPLLEGRPDDAPLFVLRNGRPSSVRALREMVVRLALRAGVEVPARPLHAFRHFAARKWKKKKLPDLTIMELMRHANLSTTQIYTQLATDELAAIHAEASPIADLLRAADALQATDEHAGEHI